MPFTTPEREPTPLIPKLELSFHSFEAAAKVMEAATQNDFLEHNDYVVMLSREEDLYMVSFLYSPRSDRNDVVFMERESFDEEYISRYMEDDNDI